MTTDRLYRIFLMTTFGMLGSILAGFIFFGTSVFIPTNTHFQYVMTGLYGSLFFSLLEYSSRRHQLYAMVILLLLQLIIFTGRYISPLYLTRDLFYLGGVFLSVKLYHLFIKRNPRIAFYLRVFSLALFYSLINSISLSLVYMINAGAAYPPLNFIIALASAGVLVGLGIGTGLDFYKQNEGRLSSWLKLRSSF